MNRMEVEDRVRALNDAWQRARFDELGECFADDVVMLLPFGDDVIRGRDAMLASYREFVDTATDIALHIRGMDVFDHGDVAVCHMTFDIAYVIDGAREQTEGLEVYVLREEADGVLRVIWRTQRLHGETPVITLEEY